MINVKDLKMERLSWRVSQSIWGVTEDDEWKDIADKPENQLG